MLIRSGLLSCTFLPLLLLKSMAQAPDLSAMSHYQFREPYPAGYYLAPASTIATVPKLASTAPAWIKAWPDNGSTNYVEFGNRIVLQLKSPADLGTLLQGRSLQLSRTVGETTFILQAPEVWTGLREAEELSKHELVLACYPVRRRRIQPSTQYSPRPNDPFFFQSDQAADHWQANLENRDTNGVSLGVDLNVRAAWAISRGEGVVLAIADDGVELDHPDLVDRTKNAPHFDFVSGQANGMPSGDFSDHATAVAGLAAATANNKTGIAGVAPKVQLASWVIWDANENLISEEAMMDMFQHESNIVSVQNHSWGKVGAEQLRMSALEDLAISNATQFGRSGLGVVLVRAGGNYRPQANNANDDGFAADPRIISVASVRLDGRVARFSAPGACLLVAAPSGDNNSEASPCIGPSPNLVTTDRQGAAGYSSGDYTYGADSPFIGTSASAPQIAGVVALLLAANTNLTYRDVQQILVLSSRHFDLTDLTLITNGAGFRVSHNLGFGVPDAGLAVALAQAWSNRPPVSTSTLTVTNSLAIPDLGLRVQLQGTGVPDELRSIPAMPGDGLHPDASTLMLPLVDVGLATNAISSDLRGKAALMRRGVSYFCEKVSFAAQAGAAFAIIYNDRHGDERVAMVGTDLSSIPAVFISQNDGEALRDLLAVQPDVQAQLHLTATNCTFAVTNTLLCEHVGVRLKTDHTGRGDLRMVLTSPAGTRSVLQRANQDSLPGPSDWTYYSVQHFYESSAGVWTLSVADEDTKGTGSVTSASLIIRGVPITDSDHDGLDDNWEMRYFQSLAYGPGDDPDHDGYSNAREQILGTNPASTETPLRLDLSVWDNRLARLSWPSSDQEVYRIQIGSETIAPLTYATNVPGRFYQTEWFVPYTNLVHQFFRIEAIPKGN